MIEGLHVFLLSPGRLHGFAYGGQERFTLSLGRWMEKRKHKVSLLGIDCAGLKIRNIYESGDRRDNTKGMAKGTNKRAISLRYFFYSLRLIIWLFQVVRILLVSIKSPPTLIHAQDAAYTGLAAVFAGKILRIPVVISLHGFRYRQIELETSLNWLIKKLLLRLENHLDEFALRHADTVIVVNSTLKDYCESIKMKNIYVIPPAIKKINFEFSDLKRDFLRKQLGIAEQVRLIGYVGRLSPGKNLCNLLVSFADAAYSYPLMRLIIVGEGPLEHDLKKIAVDHNIKDKVIFYGAREDIGNILSSFDVFIFLSFTEGLSTALLEAMATGRAIICSNIESNRSVVTDNKEGILVDPNDLDHIKNAIHLLCNDDSLRLRLGHNAKIKASQYDEDVVFPRILRCYEDILSR